MATPQTKQLKISPEIQAEMAAIAAGTGCELLRVSFQRNVLQILLDKVDGGVTLEHCQTVSKQVSALLDVSEFGSDRYVLEVSSPGLDRELFRPQDYERFTGSLVKVAYFEGGARSGKKSIVGRLTAYDAAAGTITVDEAGAASKPGAVEKAGPSPRIIPLRDVAKARLEIEL